MEDYRGIETLYTIIELQSFEMAAKKLHITQSAVSQRIKAVENQYGEPILIRTLPYKPTTLGKQLIAHFQKVCLLEEELQKQLDPASTHPHLSIAISRDSLETWFLKWASESKAICQVHLEVIACDQELTLDLLKNGRVSAALSTAEKAVIGGETLFVGYMDYMLVASPSLIKRFFSGKNLKQNLLKAPVIKFDQEDMLHEKYLETFFQIDSKELKSYVIPSVQGFKQFALLGYGYGLIPKIDILEELKQKQLTPLSEKVWKMPMYWHSWSIQSSFYRKLNQEIIEHLKKTYGFF